MIDSRLAWELIKNKYPSQITNFAPPRAINVQLSTQQEGVGLNDLIKKIVGSNERATLFGKLQIIIACGTTADTTPLAYDFTTELQDFGGKIIEIQEKAMVTTTTEAEEIRLVNKTKVFDFDCIELYKTANTSLTNIDNISINFTGWLINLS